MTAVVHLASARPVEEAEVLRAFYTHRALLLAEVNDPRLANDLAHQSATTEARMKFQRLYDEWVRR